MSTPNAGSNSGPTRSIVSQITLLLGLVVLWCLLWGKADVLTIVTGIALAVLVSLVFYLPAVQLSGRINVLWAAYFFGRLVVDIVRASAQITWLVTKPAYRPSNAIIEVPLSTRSDLIMSATAEAISLVPGSIVVDLDRANSVLYLHSLDTHDEADVERVLSEALGTERRLVMAFGSRDDVDRVTARDAGATPTARARPEAETGSTATEGNS